MGWLKLASSRVGLFLISCVVSTLVTLWFQHQAYKRGVADEKARQLTAMTQAMGAMRKRHEQELRARGWQDTSEAERARAINVDLQNRLAELAAKPPKTLIQTVVQHDESGCSCPIVSLGPEFWMSYRAAGTGGGAADPVPADPVPNQM